MHLGFNLPSQYHFQFSTAIPRKYTGFVLPGGAVLSATDPDFGMVVQQEFAHTNYTIRFNFFDVLQPFTLRCLQGGARLVSFLSLRNTLDYDIEGVGNLKLKQGQFSLLHTVDRPAAANFFRPKAYECMEIAWSDEWVQSVLPKFSFLEPVFMPMTRPRKGFFLHPKPRPAGTRALDIANAILRTPYEPDLSRLFFKNQAHEYMLLLLIESAKKARPLVHLTERQRDTIITIGNRVRTGYNQQFHLADLSREAGMNTTTLKNGFREIHGGPISRVHMSARMQEARRLLAETDLSTKQIAEKVGYALTTSFLKNFQKFFGYYASEVPRRE